MACDSTYRVIINVLKDSVILSFYCCRIYFKKARIEIPIKKFLALNKQGVIDALNSLKEKNDLFNVPGYKQHEYEFCKGAETCEKLQEVRGVQVSMQGCNLRCIMCCAHQQTTENRYAFFKYYSIIASNYFAVLEKLKGLQLEYFVTNCSGEPFLFKDKLLKFLNSCDKNDFKKIVTITNGTLLDEESIKQLAEIRKRFEEYFFIISMDSHIKETYEKIRVGAKFEKTIENIKLLKKYNLNFLINYVIQKENLDELEESYDYFINKLGVDITYVIKRNAHDKEDYIISNNDKEILNDKRVKEFYNNYKEAFKGIELY